MGFGFYEGLAQRSNSEPVGGGLPAEGSPYPSGGFKHKSPQAHEAKIAGTTPRMPAI